MRTPERVVADRAADMARIVDELCVEIKKTHNASQVTFDGRAIAEMAIAIYDDLARSEK
jgi:hypothetical protein